jgi:hypothetical protein
MAAAMANHASTRKTQHYDRRRDEVSLDEVERNRDLGETQCSSFAAFYLLFFP